MADSNFDFRQSDNLDQGQTLFPAGQGFAMPSSADISSPGFNLNLPPPILTVPLSSDPFTYVQQIETQYQLNYAAEFAQMFPENPQQGNVAHSLRLLDHAIDFLNEENLPAANDLFSLCLILYPNYLYNYFLALTRHQLNDDIGALSLIEEALKQMRERQSLDSELASLSQDIDFAQHFYTLYAILLFQNKKIPDAKAIIQFMLQSQILHDPTIIFSLIEPLQDIQDTATVATLSKVALAEIEKMSNVQEKNELLDNLKTLLG